MPYNLVWLFPAAAVALHFGVMREAVHDERDEEAQARVYDRGLAVRLLKYVYPYRRLAILALLLLCLQGALQLVAPALTRHVIDVALPARDMTQIWLAALLLVVSLLVQFACSYGDTILTSRLGQRVMHDMRMHIFSRLQELPISFFSRTPAGRVMTRVTSDVEALNELLTSGVVAGMGDLFTLTAIGVAMLVVDWRLALAAFLVIPLVILVSALFRAKVRVAYREIRVRLARINGFLQEKLTGMRVVQLFGMEDREKERFDELNRDHLVWHLRSITVYALYFPVIEILTATALASLLAGGSAGVEGGTLTVGTLAAFLMLVRRFFQPLQDLSEKYNILQGAMAASERIFALLDEPGGESGLQAPAAASALRRVPGSGYDATVADHTRTHGQLRAVSEGDGVSVEFRNVWFAYPDASGKVAPGSRGEDQGEWVLRDVTFLLAAGESLAVVGHTGAGKTTLINLLLRFYTPQRGSILVDGVDIQEMSLFELRRMIGYVQQDIFLFAGDIESNIRLSLPIGREEVAAAARSVGADAFIARLPGGYGHVLGERGASLSTGERQLLAFARGVAARPRLLLLDEATSSIDSELEARIGAAVGELMRGRTTIAVAHRLSTIAASDSILVLHHGRVAERGTHEGLIRAGGLYERLYRLQFGGESESQGTVSP